ncbi:MAG: hypothetical protein NZ481_09150 [Candidatus Kapabacteria bacterium]|nr:hypothetical protein [Candidatus Kapabacteria bacterium]
MKDILVIKTGALGDVVRTTPLIHVYGDRIVWLTSAAAKPLLPADRIGDILLPDEVERLAESRFELVISLEEDAELLQKLSTVRTEQWIGVYFDDTTQRLRYTLDSSAWFDMSLVSQYGRYAADQRKLANRRSYQELLFGMLGVEFSGQEYLLAYSNSISAPSQDEHYSFPLTIAIEERAGERWPMKQWPYYRQLAQRLEADGHTVYYLAQRPHLMEYMRDIDRCDVLICGDTLAMHLGLYLRKKIIAIFTCTSPWEIYDYGRLVKVVNPRLAEAFYRRDYDPLLAGAVSVDEVYQKFNQLLGHG